MDKKGKMTGGASGRSGRVRAMTGKRGCAGAKWWFLMVMVLTLFLFSAPAAMAETSGTGENAYAVSADTEIETPEVTDADGADPAAAAAGDDGTLGSITLNLKYKENNTEKKLTGGKLSIYNVTDLQDWSSYTSAELDEKNSGLAKAFLDDELDNAEPLATKAISNGEVRFENLPKGMYLICQSELSENEMEILPFLMSVPDKNGNINISAAPKPGIVKDTPKKVKPKKKSKLPQTGFVLWPVFMLIAGGLLLILVGAWLRKPERRPDKAGANGPQGHNRS